MKKIILLLAFCLSVGNLFAQDANADKLREEGDAAMTAKNYPERPDCASVNFPFICKADNFSCISSLSEI